MWNLKHDKNFIYETETDSQTYRTDLWFAKEEAGVEEGRIRSLGLADANYYI